MGFAASSVIAQTVSDVCSGRAGLPQAQGIREGDLPPLQPPCWGSIVDDLWVLHRETPGVGTTPGDSWLGSVEEEWKRVGLESHPGKSKSNVLGEEGFP